MGKNSAKLETVSSSKGLDIKYLRTDKFKTNSIHVFLDNTISREHATMNALLPAVMRRGCKSYPTFRDIARRLEELYGATFDCGINKKGERHIIYFYIEYVNDRYTKGNTRLFRKAADVLREIMFEPVTEKNVFRNDYVEQEKVNLKSLIEGRINDKVQYAVDRCLEEMCGDEPFGVYEYGSVPDLDGITPGGLYRHYRDILAVWPVRIYITGSVDDGEIEYLRKVFDCIEERNTQLPAKTRICREPEKVRHVNERLQVNQGKLTLGYRTNTGPADADYYALVVCNGILGGGIHSKLFKNVREKEGIAYYAFSHLEKFKGLMVAGSGIEPDKRDKAEEIICEQIEEIKKGIISRYEFDATMRAIKTGIKSLKDSPLSMVDFYLGQQIAGTDDTFDSFLKKTGNVKSNDVIRAAEKIKLDTVYFLSPGEEKPKGEKI